MDWKETSNETRLNTSNYLKEFWYLNQLEWKIPFDLCTDNVFCKKNFFSTFARYIETLKNDDNSWWENEVQNFISSIINGSFWEWFELLKNIDIYLCEKQAKRYKENWYEDLASSIEFILKHSKYLYQVEDDWKTGSSITWIRWSLIPARYYEWSKNSWLLNEIKDKNLENLAQALTMKK
jgi:hypothetical protein